MTVQLVTIEEVKSILNIETTDFDSVKLPILISAASTAVIRYLKGNAAAVIGLDENGDILPGTTVPEDIRMATAWLVGWWMSHPDDDPEEVFQQGYLPRVVTAVLYPLRDPAMA
jgi:hypothetical protein